MNRTPPPVPRSFALALALPLVLVGAACEVGDEAPLAAAPGTTVDEAELVTKLPRYAAIRDAAAARGVRNAYLLAGIANTETGLAHC